MKKLIIFSAMLIASFQTAFCQMNALKGSGKVLTKTFSYQDFEKIQLKDLDGNIEVVVGKPYAITIKIDDNLEPLLTVSENKKTLFVALSKNENNQRYVEKTNIHITINVPALNALTHIGNSDIFITGVKNNSFSVKSAGNGNVTIAGTTDKVEIDKTGNGDVEAAKLMVKNANVVSVGNGDVMVNASEIFVANLTGNGDIINRGNARASSNSKQTGNGEIRNN